MMGRKGWEIGTDSSSNLWGLHVDLTIKVIHNTLGFYNWLQRYEECTIEKKKKEASPPLSLSTTHSPFLEKVSFFLLNRAEVPTPSFLPSLKVLLRHRNKYPKKKLDKTQNENPPEREFPLQTSSLAK